MENKMDFFPQIYVDSHLFSCYYLHYIYSCSNSSKGTQNFHESNETPCMKIEDIFCVLIPEKA